MMSYKFVNYTISTEVGTPNKEYVWLNLDIPYQRNLFGISTYLPTIFLNMLRIFSILVTK